VSNSAGQRIGVVVEPNTITKHKLLSRSRNLAQLSNNIAHIIFHSDPFRSLDALFTADRPKSETPSEPSSVITGGKCCLGIHQ
jgi:hypothetical protein